MICPICSKHILEASSISFCLEGYYVCQTYIELGDGIKELHYLFRTKDPFCYVWYAPPYKIMVTKGRTNIYIVDTTAIADAIGKPIDTPPQEFFKLALTFPYEMKPEENQKMSEKIKTWITFS